MDGKSSAENLIIKESIGGRYDDFYKFIIIFIF